MKSIKSISFIGAGNVATHLAKALFDEGYLIDQVYSRNIDNALSLASEVQSIAVDNIQNINSTADLYILSVNDDGISSVLQQITDKHVFIAHTSGSIPIDIFKENGFSNYGIFYPLQTFSKTKQVNLLEVPFCIEANENENELVELANKLSNSVSLISSEQRKKLHLAAVFACNFTNYMYHIAEDICTQNDVNFNILKPLIKETAKQIATNHPMDVQTGPAMRGDEEIINHHLDQLKDSPNYQEIYQLITKNIQKK